MNERYVEVGLQVAAEMDRRGEVVDVEQVAAATAKIAEVKTGAYDAAGDPPLEAVIATDGTADGGVKAAQTLKIAPGRGKARSVIAPRWRRRGMQGTADAQVKPRRRLATMLVAAFIALAAISTLPPLGDRDVADDEAAVQSAVSASFGALIGELGGKAGAKASSPRLVELGVVNQAIAKAQTAWWYGQDEAVSLALRDEVAFAAGHFPRPAAVPVRLLARHGSDESAGLTVLRTYPPAALSGSTNDDLTLLRERFLAWASVEGITITWQCPKPEKNSKQVDGTYTWPGKVELCPGLDGERELGLICHELAHHTQGKRDRLARPRTVKEDEAAAVANVALKALGVPMDGKSDVYLGAPGRHAAGLLAARKPIEAMAAELVQAGLGRSALKPCSGDGVAGRRTR